MIAIFILFAVGVAVVGYIFYFYPPYYAKDAYIPIGTKKNPAWLSRIDGKIHRLSDRDVPESLYKYLFSHPEQR